MQPQRHVGVLGRVLGRAVERHLVERDAVHAAPGHGVVADRRQVEVASRERLEIVRLVRFEHVRLELGIVRAAGNVDAVIGERVLHVLEVLAELRASRVGEPWCKCVEHLCGTELRRRAGIAMTERNVATAGGFDRKRDADDFGRQRIGCRRRRVDRYELGRVDRCQPLRERGLGQHDFVVDAGRRLGRGRRLRLRNRNVARTGCARGTGERRIAISACDVLQPHLEFEALVQRAQPIGLRCARPRGRSASTAARSRISPSAIACPAAATRARRAGSRRRRRESRRRAR